MPVHYNPAELRDIQNLKNEPAVVERQSLVGETVASSARSMAPKRTGLGAASIDYEVVEDETGTSVRVSWGKSYYYMWFHEAGTKGGQQNGTGVSPRPFLRPAVAPFQN